MVPVIMADSVIYVEFRAVTDRQTDRNTGTSCCGVNRSKENSLGRRDDRKIASEPAGAVAYNQ